MLCYDPTPERTLRIAPNIYSRRAAFSGSAFDGERSASKLQHRLVRLRGISSPYREPAVDAVVSEASDARYPLCSCVIIPFRLLILLSVYHWPEEKENPREERRRMLHGGALRSSSALLMAVTSGSASEFASRQK